MLENLQNRWWLITARGILAILFGIVAVISPMAVIYSLLTFFSFFVVLTGFFVITLAFLAEAENKWFRVIEGLLCIVIGALILFNPASAIGGLMILVAVWAIFSGILHIVWAIRLRKLIPNEWYLIFNGVLSVLFGIILASNLLTGAAVIAMVLGIYAIINGVLFVVLSFKIRNFKVAMQT